jgi:hypothetical protein
LLPRAIDSHEKLRSNNMNVVEIIDLESLEALAETDSSETGL